MYLAHLSYISLSCWSLGCQTLRRLSTCRKLPKCGQLVHMLRKVLEVPPNVQWFNMDILRMLLAMATIVSLAYMLTSTATQPLTIRGHAMVRINKSDRHRFSQWAAIVTCGLWVWPYGGRLIMWVWIPHTKRWYAKQGEIHYSVCLVMLIQYLFTRIRDER